MKTKPNPDRVKPQYVWVIEQTHKNHMRKPLGSRRYVNAFNDGIYGTLNSAAYYYNDKESAENNITERGEKAIRVQIVFRKIAKKKT